MDMPSLTKPKQSISRADKIKEFKDLRSKRDKLNAVLDQSALEINQHLTTLTSHMRNVNRALSVASSDTKHLGTGALSRSFNGLRDMSLEASHLYEVAPPRAEQGRFTSDAADLYVAALDLRDGIKELQEHMRRGLGAGKKPESVAELDEANQELSQVLEQIIASHDRVKDSRQELEAVHSQARELRAEIDSMPAISSAQNRQRDAAAKYT